MIGDEISLPHEESHHLSKVLRLEPEASMEVLNGMGDRFQVQCLEVNSKQASESALIPSSVVPWSFH